MAKFSQIPISTEFSYAGFNYVKLTEQTALSLQGHGLLELLTNDEVIPLDDECGLELGRQKWILKN